MSDSEDECKLSAHALAALKEFYQEEKDRAEHEEASINAGDVDNFKPLEDWVSKEFLIRLTYFIFYFNFFIFAIVCNFHTSSKSVTTCVKQFTFVPLKKLFN